MDMKDFYMELHKLTKAANKEGKLRERQKVLNIFKTIEANLDNHPATLKAVVFSVIEVYKGGY